MLKRWADSLDTAQVVTTSPLSHACCAEKSCSAEGTRVRAPHGLVDRSLPFSGMCWPMRQRIRICSDAVTTPDLTKAQSSTAAACQRPRRCMLGVS